MKWVKCSERLPDTNGEIFIYDDLYDVFAIGFYDGNHFYYISTGTIGYSKTNGITHWMKPEPPKEGG